MRNKTYLRMLAIVGVVIMVIAMSALFALGPVQRTYGAPVGPSYDTTTGATLTIDTIHHEVHEGEMFHAGYTATGVADTNSVNVLLTTGAKEAHATMEVFAGGQVTVYLYEAPTTTAGTGVSIYNMKRSSTITPTAVVAQSPTVTSTGSVALVEGRILPGGNSAQTQVGGGIKTSAEWILKPSTKYLLRATNSSGSAISINMAAEWYEETP